jgi:hypothetical protein
MALTQSRVDRHIAEWEVKLSTGAFLHRSRWPSRLFHHSPIENAAQILKAGQLLSRNDSTGSRKLDVADTSVIQNRDRAHQFARLYFRPRTPTQYHIEGVRKIGDYYNGDPKAHAPTLVMLIFDSRKILTREGVRFSTGNMQSHGAMDGDTEEFFDSIDFTKVFHEGNIGGDRTITHCKCAEVLTPSPLPISDCLTSIYCRSSAERTTLLYELGSEARRWRDVIFISDDLRVFEKQYTFVESVSLQHDGVVFRLHPYRRPILCQIIIWDSVGREIARRSHPELPTVPSGSTAWRESVGLTNDTYRVRINLEECRAFEATLLLEDAPF